MNTPKRHHFVPEFYLRRFANHKRRIRMYERGKKRPVMTSVNNAAVETGFYTVEYESGAKSDHIEKWLSTVETNAAAVISRLTNGHFPPTREEREHLALFLGLQITRTPEARHMLEAMTDKTMKVLLKHQTPDSVRQRLSDEGSESTDEAVAQIMDGINNLDSYQFLPHQNEHIQMMLESADTTLSPIILEKSWLLGHCRTATFITSDHPVVFYRRPSEANRFQGLGLANAEEVYFPLGRQYVLILVPPSTVPEREMTLTNDDVLFVNSLLAWQSYKWVFQHPDDGPIDRLIPKDRRPVLVELNGQPIFWPP